jgi:hypothetical protein
VALTTHPPSSTGDYLPLALYGLIYGVIFTFTFTNLLYLLKIFFLKIRRCET